MRLLLVLVSLLLSLATHPVSAQDLTFDRAYQDYLYNYDLYKKARDEYEVARLNYLSSMTLDSKSKAETATLKMLLARDDVVITHLTLLRKAISDTVGISDSDKGSFYSQIDTEVDWYKTHKQGLPSAATLENMVAESQKAKDRFKSVTELLMYNALGRRETGKLDGFRDRISKIIADINSKLGEIRQNGDKSTQKAERWLLETDLRVTRSSQKEDAAKVVLIKLKDIFGDRLSGFSDFQNLVIESNQFLKEANSYLKEVIKEIKTAD